MKTYAVAAGLLAISAVTTSAAAEVPEACGRVEHAIGTYVPVASRGSGETILTGINERGKTVGYWTEPIDGESLRRAESFVIRRGEYIPIAMAGGVTTVAEDINASGVVVGSLYDPAVGRTQAFRWHHGEVTIIEPPQRKVLATGLRPSTPPAPSWVVSPAVSTIVTDSCMTDVPTKPSMGPGGQALLLLRTSISAETF